MKNILLVSPVPPPNGGIATWTQMYLEFFSYSKDYNVILVNTAITGNRIYTNKRNILEEIKRFNKIREEINININNKQIDIIHYNSSCTPLGLIKDFIILKKIKKQKIIYHCRCDLTNYVSNWFSKRIFTQVCSYCSKIFVLNSQSKSFAKSSTKKPVICIPNFVKLEQICIDNFHDFSKVTSFIYTGRVSHEKGCDILFKLAELLPNYRFQLIGDPNCDLDISNLPVNVELLGIYTHEQVLNKLKEDVVFLFLSRTEGFSNSVVEAMANGLPIISTNVGANRDMIENKGGLLFSLEDLDSDLKSCAKCIEKYITNQYALEEASIFNKNKVRLSYSIENVMDQILDEYFKS